MVIECWQVNVAEGRDAAGQFLRRRSASHPLAEIQTLTLPSVSTAGQPTAVSLCCVVARRNFRQFGHPMGEIMVKKVTAKPATQAAQIGSQAGWGACGKGRGAKAEAGRKTGGKGCA